MRAASGCIKPTVQGYTPAQVPSSTAMYSQLSIRALLDGDFFGLTFSIPAIDDLLEF